MRIRLSPESKYVIRQFSERWLRPLLHASIGFLAAVSAYLVLASPLGVSLEMTVLRTFFSIRGPRQAPEDVVMVLVDDESYRKLEASTNFPLPRRRIAEALERIMAAKPKAVIIDGNFPNERQIDPEADARIEAALQSGPSTIWSGAIEKLNGDASNRVPSDERFRKAAKMELPMIGYFAAGNAIYLVNPTLASGTVQELAPISRPLIELAQLPISTPSPRSLINFYGGPGTIPSLSIYRLTDIGDNEVASTLRDKVVLIGYGSLHMARGTSHKDAFPVPISTDPMFGVEIHANTLGNLIDGTGLNRWSRSTELCLLALVATLIGSYAAWRISPVTMALLTVGLCALHLGAYIAFAHYHFWVANVGVLTATYFIAMTLSGVALFRRARSYKQYVDKSFEFQINREL